MVSMLKANLVTLISGVLIIALSVFAVLGMTSGKVVKEMKSLTGRFASISSLKGSAKNKAVVDDALRRSEQMKQEVERAKEALAAVNGRKVLMDDVFPGPTSETRRFDYKEAYEKVFGGWVRQLNSSGIPGVLELQQAQSDIDEIIARMEEQQKENAVEEEAIGETKKKVVEASKDDPRFSAKIRAETTKAAEIRMYVDFEGPRNQSTFHISPIITTDTAPPLDEMWYAQVGLWIQQDIVNAIKAVNDAAAAKLDSETPDVVQSMPIKRLDLVKINGYVLGSGNILPFARQGGDPSGGGGGGGGFATPVAGSAGPATLTGRTSNETTDVVRFEVSLVSDQRDLLQFMDQMSRQNLYVCIDCDYEGVKPDEVTAGYYYGSEPLVRARMVFETYFIRSIYDKLMPESVRAKFGGSES